MQSASTTAIVPSALIAQKIYFARNTRVMLDADLAALYGVATRVLIQAVKRNAERFPPDFMFQITKEEVDLLRSQFVTSKYTRRLNQGESGILKSQIVISSWGWQTPVSSLLLHGSSEIREIS